MQMKVKDLNQQDIHIGMLIRSLKDETLSIVVCTDYKDDNYSWTLNSKDNYPRSGFYGTDCECDLIFCSGKIDLREYYKNEVKILNEKMFALINKAGSF